MKFEEGYSKVLNLIPKEMKLISVDNDPCFEIKLNKDLTPTGEICFTLESIENSNKMNIKVNQNAEILEAYPLTNAAKDRRPFKLKKDEIKEGCIPYLSIDIPNNKITHIYYISSKTNVLTRKDLEGNFREYHFYMLYDENFKDIFKKYSPVYIYTYHPVGHPESPTAYLLGFNKYCKSYQSLKTNLFQLIK